MTCKEFNELSGLDIPEYNYDKIEAVYMNAGDMDEETFAKAYQQLIGRSEAVDLVHELSDAVTRKESVINKLKAENNNVLIENAYLHQSIEKNIRENVELSNAVNEANAKLQQAAKLLLDAKLEQQAIDLLGHSAVIALKIKRNDTLNANDLNYISNNLK